MDYYEYLARIKKKAYMLAHRIKPKMKYEGDNIGDYIKRFCDAEKKNAK